jgi:hypothetical protein
MAGRVTHVSYSKSIGALAAIAFSVITGCATVNSQAPALVEYERSGGIAGRQDRLVVHVDGSARRYRRGAPTTFTVSGDTLTQLRQLLQGIRFDTLRAEYLPPRPGADLFEYVVVYAKRSIRTMDTAVPPELQPLIQLLSDLVNRRP